MTFSFAGEAVSTKSSRAEPSCQSLVKEYGVGASDGSSDVKSSSNGCTVDASKKVQNNLYAHPVGSEGISLNHNAQFTIHDIYCLQAAKPCRGRYPLRLTPVAKA